MSSPQDTERGALQLAIDGELTVYRAAELKTTLLNAVESGQTVDIDLSGVTEIDTAGIQLLMAAKRGARRHGVCLHLCAHSPAVIDAIELLDLAAFFGDPLVVPSATA